MASFTKHDTRWRAHVFRNGVRATKILPTKREAQAWALKKEAELDTLASPGGKTILTAVTHYLKTVSPTKSEGAPDWEQRKFGYMLEFFGETTRLSQIGSERIGQWRDHRLQTVSGTTVQREANLLRNLFSVAVDEWRWLDRNPFKGVRLPKENPARTSVWRWQEIKRVLRAGQRSGGKIGEMALAFHIALRTGMRLQEVLSAPPNFDAARRVVTVRTKTSERGEEIPIGRIGAKLLKEARFTVGPNEGSTLFSKLTRSLMIKGLTFHDSRATALTLLAKKVDVMVLARVSRHKDISLLHRVYYRTTASEIASKL